MFRFLGERSRPSPEPVLFGEGERDLSRSSGAGEALDDGNGMEASPGDLTSGDIDGSKVDEMVIDDFLRSLLTRSESDPITFTPEPYQAVRTLAEEMSELQEKFERFVGKGGEFADNGVRSALKI